MTPDKVRSTLVKVGLGAAGGVCAVLLDALPEPWRHIAIAAAMGALFTKAWGPR